jgi:hypothetical protein
LACFRERCSVRGGKRLHGQCTGPAPGMPDTEHSAFKGCPFGRRMATLRPGYERETCQLANAKDIPGVSFPPGRSQKEVDMVCNRQKKRFPKSSRLAGADVT